MYGSERERILERDFGGRFDAVNAGEAFGQHLRAPASITCWSAGTSTASASSTWATTPGWSSRGVSLEEFDARRDQSYWRGLRELLPVWDELIERFNARTGLAG